MERRDGHVGYLRDFTDRRGLAGGSSKRLNGIQDAVTLVQIERLTRHDLSSELGYTRLFGISHASN